MAGAAVEISVFPRADRLSLAVGCADIPLCLLFPARSQFQLAPYFACSLLKGDAGVEGVGVEGGKHHVEGCFLGGLSRVVVLGRETVEVRGGKVKGGTC